jgi:hypothetical protein
MLLGIEHYARSVPGGETAGNGAQLSVNFASYGCAVIGSLRFAVICCKRYKIAARKPLPQKFDRSLLTAHRLPFIPDFWILTPDSFYYPVHLFPFLTFSLC